MTQTLTRPEQQSGKTAAGRAIVIGGGLAGMAAAVALESAGVSVTLVEMRKSLGGRASSFVDPQSGEELDNCQHILLGCCTNLRDFYKRMGVMDRIRWERTVHFRDARGQHDLWRMGGLPAPLHLGAGMVGFGVLSVKQRWALVRAMMAMIRLGRKGREELADVEFGQWLNEYGQDAGLIDRFYDPVLRGALNEEPRKASAKYAIQVFQEAMLVNAAGHVMGLPVCPLGELYRNAPCGDVRCGVRVAGLRFAGMGVSGVELADGQVLVGDAYVLAVNHHLVSQWLPEELARGDERFGGLEKLESVPILGAHLWFDRPVMAQSHAVLLEGPLQWVFRKDRAGRVLHGVISAAREWADRSREECLGAFESQIRRLLPAAREAKLERGLVVVEKRATFSPVPGVDRWRPMQTPPPGGIGNLFLAGDYTRTDWPATMEGAVRSGYLAAEGVAEKLGENHGSGARFLVDGLVAQWPWRLLTGRR